MKNKEAWFYVIAFLAGALVWGVVSAVSGRKEAWDSSWYFSIGYPAICLMAFAMGFFVPKWSWCRGATPIAGQFVRTRHRARSRPTRTLWRILGRVAPAAGA